MRIYRQVVLLLLMTLGMGMLALRLAWLQVVPALWPGSGAATYAQAAVNQRRSVVTLDDGRGRLLDRSGLPLAGVEIQALLLLPEIRNASADETGRLAALLGMTTSEWNEAVSGTLPAMWRRAGEKEPATLSNSQSAQIREAGIAGLRIVPYVRRYPDPPLASHLIGYVGQNPDAVKTLYKERVAKGTVRLDQQIGAAGLERSLEPLLRPRGKLQMAWYGNGETKVVDTLGNYYPLFVRTTIDARLQQRIERLLQRSGAAEGAVAVLDAATGDIAAMASRPDYDPYAVVPQRNNWRNVALQPDIPGSVFKLVVAAAALDSGAARPGQLFQCDGRKRYGIRCWKPGGHGAITLERALAESCNAAFAELAVRTGPQALERTAARLGLLRASGWSAEQLAVPGEVIRNFRQLDGDRAGQLFAAGARPADTGAIAQTGIGQRDVRMSPLHAAGIVVAAVNGGWMSAPRAVSEATMRNGRIAARFPAAAHRRQAMSGTTARWLMRAMQSAVAGGTASALSAAPGGAGGKTGTAETGVPGQAHHWFVGFAPAANPKYAFAILIRNQPFRGPNQAVRLAEELLYILSDT